MATRLAILARDCIAPFTKSWLVAVGTESFIAGLAMKHAIRHAVFAIPILTIFTQVEESAIHTIRHIARITCRHKFAFATLRVVAIVTRSNAAQACFFTAVLAFWWCTANAECSFCLLTHGGTVFTESLLAAITLVWFSFCQHGRFAFLTEPWKATYVAVHPLARLSQIEDFLERQKVRNLGECINIKNSLDESSIRRHGRKD